MRFAGRSLAVPSLGLILAWSLGAGCGSEGGGKTTCQSLCHLQAECFGVCDYPEEPGCDPQALYLEEYTRCLEACEGAQTTRGDECQAATLGRLGCLQQSECGQVQAGPCATAEMRYYEVCHLAPGDWVCPNFCGELELGCLPWELFGYRGLDCVATCKADVQEAGCREAHYAFDECTEGLGYACTLFDDTCAAAAATLADACPAWAPAAAIPAEDAACAPVGVNQCACGLMLAERDCAALGANRCRFEYGKGQPCVDAIQAFDLCMTGLTGCTRDLLRESCLPQWEQWNEACKP